MLYVNGRVVFQNRFPDGTLNMKVDKLPFDSINVITWAYESDAELFSLICLTKKLRERWNLDVLIRLYLPYIPHARMDRVKDEEDVFTLKYFADVINSLGFDRVLVHDPHSSVACSLINRIQIAEVRFFFEEVFASLHEHEGVEYGDVLICYPDEGAMKRYSDKIGDIYACGTVFGIKRRDWRTGKIEGLDVNGDLNKVKGSNVLIIDDICSRGGTFFHTATKLKELGAENIYLCVSHCENTVLKGDLLKGDLIRKMYTTDSIFSENHPKIEVMPL